MSRADDLVPLFGETPDGTPPLKFRQGQIVEWDPNTGNNKVDVQGVQLVNVPMMNTGEAIALKAGHIVGLFLWGHSWFIVGRITEPGDSDFASATLDFGLITAFTSNFTIPTADTAVASAVMPCPTWARQALVSMSAVADLFNTNALAGSVFMTPVVASLSGPSIQHGYAPTGNAQLQHIQAISTTHHVLIDLPGTPGQTIAVEVRLRNNSGVLWAASAFNTAFISAAATFKSTV